MNRFIIIVSVVFFLILDGLLTAQEIPDEWLTHFEKSNYLETPDYNESMEYFQKLDDASEFAKFVTFGVSPQGRELKCLIISKDKSFAAEEIKKSGKPIVMIINGIHSGEINGKDACMILCREILITKEHADFMNNAVLMIVPIFSVDAHERRGPFNRINQIGPKEMGWRTTAQNLNLNRDFTKADAPEMQSLLKLFSGYLPDFFIDVHSTDGADYQYTTTYSIEHNQNAAKPIADWVQNTFTPYLVKRVNEKGYLIAPYIIPVEHNPEKGITDWVSLPRLSNGYAAVQNRPGLLIESHILKNYKDRVFSTKAVLESVLELINSSPETLLDIDRQADKFAVENYVDNHKPVPLTFEMTKEYDEFDFKGIKYEEVESKVSGTKVRHYTGEKFESLVPYFNHAKITSEVVLPEAYVIPREWNQIADRMALHGIKYERLNEDKKYVVERYKFYDVTFPKNPYEGRFLPDYKFELYKDTITARKGDFIIPSRQRNAALIAHLLEPAGEDSFVKWGFFNSIFERAEYFEDYAIEPIAEKMLETDTKLREEFNAKLRADSSFANNARARFDFFYERTPYYDSKYNQYPVCRIVEEI